MRFLLDVCAASRSLQAMRLSEGHDVLSAIDLDPTASDVELMDLAREQGGVLITEDKDFGELGSFDDNRTPASFVSPT